MKITTLNRRFINDIIRFFIIGLFGLSIITSCDDNKGLNNQIDKLELNDSLIINYSDYTDTIRLIEKKVVDLTAPSDLFRIDEFLTLFENQIKYFRVAERFLSDTNFTIQQREICLLSMQKPDLKINYYISRICCDLHKKGVIDDNFLIFSILPPVIHNYELIKNYNISEIQDLFKSIANQIDDKDAKKMMDLAISGKLWKNQKVYLEATGYEIK